MPFAGQYEIKWVSILFITLCGAIFILSINNKTRLKLKFGYLFRNGRNNSPYEQLVVGTISEPILLPIEIFMFYKSQALF